MTGTESPGYHVLLIGVDAYPDEAQLFGCVNDIDAIQRILVDRAGIATDRITRLASPHPGDDHETDVPELPATLDNIRGAFAELGSDDVRPGDRVFVYYAGHGTRLEVTADDHALHREALVPVDATMGGPNVLYDFELNALIADITRRTDAVALILDCCQSAGATRSIQEEGARTRYIDLRGYLDAGETVTLSAEQTERLVRTRGTDSRIAGSVELCQVVAGCLSHEQVQEKPLNGVQHGLLTHSLISVLQDVHDDELTTVPWGRLWNQLRAAIESSNPAQHLWMSGGLARAWLAGPPAIGDVGLTIDRQADEYRVRAGQVAGITVGTRLAVYGDQPAIFPPLGSTADAVARFTDVALEVTSATESESTARAIGDPFDLPDGARARVIEAGDTERLACAVVPEDDAIVAALTASQLLQVTPERAALARLERRSDGGWVLVDDVHGVGPDDPVLHRLSTDDVVARARSVLEHYVRYAAPIRMARRCADLPGALQVRLLACPPTGTVAAEEASSLPEVEMADDSSYRMSAGDRFCIRVRNTAREQLQVTLLDSEATGRVVVVGKRMTIDAGHDEFFWLQSEIGRPFTAGMTPPDATECIDRLVAIGTSALGADLEHMAESREWDTPVERGGWGDSSPPADRWTATETIVRTRR